MGWAHHIERLMVVGNLMNLARIHPQAVHQWFMEMYVDSAHWVMGPNVYGMALFSDGGIFATKPYICGSSYIRKMGDYGKGDWCDVVDGLYWRFVHDHQAYLAKNHRTAMMPRNLARLKADRRETIFSAADDFLKRKTIIQSV
jgi:deoxyribodipyrimidine photolyase-related protein